ncbi:MAG: InlB B-repeat-containing protein [Tissierellia bacterium]|nr:InlB B-repeat-containing protein [Tissierellia bacterium]
MAHNNTIKNKRINKYLAFLLLIAMVIGTLPSIAFAEGEDVAIRAALPDPNWEEPEPGDPNYWPLPNGYYYSGTKIIYNGLRYNSKTSNTFKMTYLVCLEAIDLALDYLEIKVDADLVQYIDKLRAKTYLTNNWHDMENLGNGVYRVKFNSVVGANFGALTQSLIDIDITLKDPHTTDNIPFKEYIVQSRVSGSRSGGRKIIAKESKGIGAVLMEDPVTNVANSNWLNEPALIITEFDPDTNILTYKWRTNPNVIYGAAIRAEKPYALNVVVDPVIIEASESINVRAEKALFPGTNYPINKALFDTTSNPGYATAKITYENGSVPRVGIHDVGAYIANTGAWDTPIYTVMEFKINPELIFTDDYHHNAPVKMFFTEKLNSSQRLIKNSSAENFFILSKTFYLPEVDDAYTEDTKISGFTQGADMFVKITLPDGTNATGRSAEEPNAEGKYPFSIDLPAGTELNKGDEIVVQNAEYGKALSNPVVETVNAKITFDQNYTGAPEAQVVIANDDKNINNLGDLMPAVPTREGYAFGGWFDNVEGNGEEFTAESTINKSKTVYAKWDKQIPYTVEYYIGKVKDESLTKTGFVPETKPYLLLEDIKVEIPDKNFLKVDPESDSLGRVNIPAIGIVKMYYDGDIIDVIDPDDPTPPGYSRVIFDAKENGKFEDGVIYMFDVKNGVEFPEDKAPDVVPNVGYTFKEWNPKLPSVISGPTTIDAIYNELPDIIGPFDPNNPPERPDGYMCQIRYSDIILTKHKSTNT